MGQSRVFVDNSFSQFGDLGRLFQDQNLKDIELEKVPMDPAYYGYFLDKTLAASKDFSYDFLDVMWAGTNNGAHVRSLIAKASEERMKGVGMAVDMVTFVGRK